MMHIQAKQWFLGKIFGLLLVSGLMAGDVAVAQNQKVFYIGHSLSDQIPDMVKSLSDDHPQVGLDWRYQWIPGAPLWWQWDRKAMQDYNPIPPHYIGFYVPAGGLPEGGFDVLVLTESVPRHWASIGDTHQFADSFFVYANQFNPNLRVFIYEIWHCLDSGTPTGCDYDLDSNPWRQRLTDDLPMWQSVVDTLNTRFSPANPICLIPAGQGLAALYDSIQAGVVPGVNQIDDLFYDRIHLNDVGKYFIACIHFAAIHQKSPVGLTNQTQVWWGGNFNPPSPALALKFQEIAWQTVNNYPDNCLETTAVHAEQPHEEGFWPYPNPASDAIWLNYEGESRQWMLYDLFGRLIQTGISKKISVDDLPAGLYTIQVGQISKVFVRQ